MYDIWIKNLPQKNKFNKKKLTFSYCAVNFYPNAVHFILNLMQLNSISPQFFLCAFIIEKFTYEFLVNDK